MEEIIIDPASDLFYKDYNKWVKGLWYFLFTKIIPLVLPKDNKNRDLYAKILLSNDAMSIWIVCFTDQSVDRNPSNNNQMLETLGDRELESLFSNFVVNLYPKMTESLLTELKSTYMSKNKQKDMANKLELNKWVRSNFDNTIHTSEDLFESLFGALFKIGETYIGKGNGYALCSNLLTHLYYDLVIDPNAILLRSITQVKEIVEKLGWGQKNPDKFVKEELCVMQNIENEDSDYKWSLVLKLTKNAKVFIENILKKNIVNGGIIASQSGTNKTTLRNAAFDEAVRNLKELYGVDYDWASKYSEVELDSLVESIAKGRMDQDKIVSAYFPKITKSEKSQFLQFVGIDKSSNYIILSSIVGDFKDPLINLKIFAIRLYANSGKQDPTQPIIYDPNYV